MGKRILVTGASGFVGANLARRVLQDGHEVHLLLRASHQPWRLQEFASDVRFHSADLRDQEAVRAVVGEIRPEWVFHLAAYGAYSTQHGMAQMVATNVLGCVALLDACTKTGIEAFVNSGSSSEYGIKEHAASEDENLEPNSHYAVTKAAATHYCQFTARKLNLNAITVRLYSIYGPYEEPSRLIPTLLVNGLRGSLPPLVSPETARDFVFVEDAVDAMITVAKATGIPRGSVYNICSGRQVRLDETVDMVRELLGVKVEPAWATMPNRAWDTNSWVGSPAKLEQATGWRAKTGFRAGLKTTVDWLSSNPDRLRFYEQRIES